ncbi:MAG TPA: hypothetical protein PKI32_04775 [Opitutales bacterium]|nr:hypothetical protein [Opitutales bacterium]
MTKYCLTLAAACAASLFPIHVNAVAGTVEVPPSQAYVWKPVRMGGCGFVTGIVFHPGEKGLAYCRTDMGGAYRRDSEKGEWVPLLDWMSLDDVNLMGVESIAVDPSNPDLLYMACGTNSSDTAPFGAILRSKDRGRTFEIVRIPVKFGGNENGRGNGERMAVDPKNGSVIFLGTRHDGLLVSRDGGSSWARVTSFPDAADLAPEGLSGNAAREGWLRTQAGSGVIRILFAPGGASTDRSDRITAAISVSGRESLFESRDGGESWSALPGQPVKFMPTDMDLSPEGFLYVSYGTNPGPWPMKDGAVWRFDTNTASWRDITPALSGMTPGDEHNYFGYCSVAVDPEKPGVVLAMPFWYVGGEEIFRSLDGGATWKPVIRTCGNFDYSRIPYAAVPIIHWLFDVEIDPFDRDHCIFTTGFGGMESFDFGKVDAATSKENGNTWVPMMAGIEESVPLDMLAPSEGATLITAVGDYGGFVHDDLDVFAPEGNFANPRFDNTTGLALAEGKQSEIVRVGTSWKGKTANIAFSHDGGRSWVCGSNPAEGARNGSVALSSDGTTVVWTPDPIRKPGDWRVIVRTFLPQRSVDGGRTWTSCAGLPEGIRVTADKVNPQRFYAFDVFARTFFESGDGAVSFSARRVTLEGGIPVVPEQRGDGRGGQDRVCTEPGREKGVWLALFDGLYAMDAEGRFARVPHVTELRAFAFGKAAHGAARPAIYVVGIVDGVRGIFRSDDLGANFVRINDDRHQWASLLLLEGDMRTYGRIYVGTHGRGALYGDIAAPSDDAEHR